MSRYRYILFDAADTLFDFAQAEQNALRETFHEFSVPFDDATVSTYLTINRGLWKELELGSIDRKTIQKIRFVKLFEEIGVTSSGVEAGNFYQTRLGMQTALIPYAKELCQNLYGKADLSIVTNGIAQTQRTRIMNSEIWPTISHLVISEDVGVSKPDKRIFEKAFELIGCTDRKEILIVGDSLSSDMQGGINAGIDCCWYNAKKETVPSGVTITYIVEDLREIERIVL